MRIKCLVVATVLTMISFSHGQVAPGTPGWFAFDVPALAVPDGGVVDLSHLNAEPITGPGFVAVSDGHFVDASGHRLRLFGTNVTGDSCFPDEDVAPRLARRLRQYGFNCLRLHFMDYSWGGTSRDSLWDDPAAGKLSDRNLAKLDRLIAECAANGIYLNLNLHVGREYPGQPKVAGSRTFRFSKNLDRWHEPFIRHMEQFCRDLLNHVNPHTGRRYADEPAIACVEINNENTMIRDDLSDLRRLPEPFLGALEQQWTTWLRQRYGTTAALRRAWNADVVPMGEEQLTNVDAWIVQNAGGAVSTLEKEDGRLTWTATARGTASWNLQLQYKGLELVPGRYTLTFRARSRDSKRVGINVMLDAEPWENVGLSDTITLSPDWQAFTLSGPIKAATAPGPLRLNISLRNETGQVEFEGDESTAWRRRRVARYGQPGQRRRPARDNSRCRCQTGLDAFPDRYRNGDDRTHRTVAEGGNRVQDAGGRHAGLVRRRCRRASGRQRCVTMSTSTATGNIHTTRGMKLAE